MSYYKKRYNQVEYVVKSGGQADSENPSSKSNYSNKYNEEPESYKGSYKGEKYGKDLNKNAQDFVPYQEKDEQERPYKKNYNRRPNNQGKQYPQDGQNTQNLENNQRYPPKKNYGGSRNQRDGQEQDNFGSEEFRGGSRGGRGRGNRGGGHRGGRGGYKGPRGQNREPNQKGQDQYEEEKINEPKYDNPQGNINNEESKDSNEEREEGDEEEFEDFTNIPQSELAEILKERFMRNHIQCPICLNKVKKDARMWSCKQCFGPFHLSCLQRWIHKNPANLKDGKIIPNLKYFNWACPKCNYNYTEEMPQYKCFCGKEHEPEYDHYSVPHSCGNTCGKFRGSACIHPCPLTCHPGPCPPCRSMGKEQACFCGLKKMRVRCGDELAGFTCGELCNKPLSCGKHFCEEVCHGGPCKKCEVTSEVYCFCGKNSEIRECGDEDFSCKDVCGKTLDCGNHKCKAVCHSGPCAECPYTPEKMTTCCCGRMSTMVLGADNRKSCLDPIPICGLPCDKVMACGHKCKKMCHPYECGPCNIIVEQACRCTKSEREIECYKTKSEKEDERIFLCDRVCKKSKSCRVHKCQRVCCEASKGNDPEGHHLCIKVCGKTLNCGKHTCEDFCHLGNCKQCPILINYPLSCSCGKTVKHPPLPCGTHRPDCSQPCSRSRECGHPCYLKCHYDNCPPCEELIDKPCRCGKKIMKNVRCAREALCGVPCTTQLACGHKCGIVCHEGPCDMERGLNGCGAKCKKIKPECGHPCEVLCHPQRFCPEGKCKVQVRIKCECGNRESLINCGDRTSVKLECDKTCANLRRFGGFIQREADKKPYYPPMLVRFAKNNLNLVLRIEDRLEKLVKEGKDITDFALSDVTSAKKHALYQLLSRTYCLELEFFLHVKNPSVVVRWNKDSKFPPMKLSEYLKQIESGKIVPDILPFEATIKFYNLSVLDSTEELERLLLKEFPDEYYLEKNENRQVMVHFWKKDVGEIALRTIKKNLPTFASAFLEENINLKAEEEKIALTEAEIKALANQNEQGGEEGSKNDVFLALNK